eukprot:jgi/Tetstr1/446443/TSEL_033985.t1
MHVAARGAGCDSGRRRPTLEKLRRRRRRRSRSSSITPAPFRASLHPSSDIPCAVGIMAHFNVAPVIFDGRSDGCLPTEPPRRAVPRCFWTLSHKMKLRSPPPSEPLVLQQACVPDVSPSRRCSLSAKPFLHA